MPQALDPVTEHHIERSTSVCSDSSGELLD